MGCLIQNELYKVFRLKKLYLLTLVALVIEIAAALQGKLGGVPSELRRLKIQYFPILLFDYLPFLFVIFAAVFFTDSWVDEYRSGVLKLSLLRPVNRIAFLNAKVISYFVCAAALMGFLLLSAYAVGAILSGWGEHIKIGELLLILKSGAVTLLPVFGFGLLVLFIAVLTENMAVTVGCTVGLLLISQMLEISDELRDYSIIYMIQAFYKNLFLQFEWEQVIINIAVIAAYIIIFYTGCVLLFRKKDLLI
ncbi:ABC-type transport system involved in multi-copper enzyme maturation permease subunit [Paenibacillus rhizosphaerae]|uniref:ABC-type transport system involved in multi-copper enzyme maturation permease subunit n=1 Tax=Paenibacillus rhizosphaerae TaxID=297318 RepID=A0A839TVF8_9BACL|nr:ABC transporter permease [Paenibacillus rhizosphaerae]MBB3128677.1 ABC-type transport system involved in multi-copper enzyme maturation permease subunit [Paenibacillus rhizosphaerae]